MLESLRTNVVAKIQAEAFEKVFRIASNKFKSVLDLRIRGLLQCSIEFR